MIKKIIIAIIAIVLVISIYFSGIISFSILGGDYHTGFSASDFNNMETYHLKTGCWDFLGERGCWWGNIIEDYDELIMTPAFNRPIVTAMYADPETESVDITLIGNICYDATFGIWHPHYGWYRVFIKESITDDWTEIINTKNNQVDESIVSYITGKTTKQEYYDKSGGVIIPGLIIADQKSLLPITFRITGPHVGIMKVQQITQYSAVGFADEEKVSSEDHTFMVSGKGNVDIVGSQTRYVEGDTIKFRTSTDYSGVTQGGESTEYGWTLRVFDNYGQVRKTWVIADDTYNNRYDVNGHALDYVIPGDSFNPTGSNIWTVTLTNTLFLQDDDQFFAISQEALAQAPDIEDIEFSEVEYHLGDKVEIYLRGIPNPEGKNTIDGFLVNVIYGTTGIDYVLDYHVKYIPAISNMATISFTSAKGDTYITVEAWAFDAPEYEGGIMSEIAMGQVWVMDKSHEPIQNDVILAIVVALIVFVMFILIAIFAPIPGGWAGKIVIIILGALIAYVVYILMADYIVLLSTIPISVITSRIKDSLRGGHKR